MWRPTSLINPRKLPLKAKKGGKNFEKKISAESKLRRINQHKKKSQE